MLNTTGVQVELTLVFLLPSCVWWVITAVLCNQRGDLIGGVAYILLASMTGMMIRAG